MEGSERDSGLRLVELVAAFSLAMDLGLGQPMEHVLRSWLIAARLGDHVGLERDQRGSLYYMATLAWVGCVADTPEVATWFGDDIAYRGDSYKIDLAGLPMLGFMLRHVGAGRPALRRRSSWNCLPPATSSAWLPPWRATPTLGCCFPYGLEEDAGVILCTIEAVRLGCKGGSEGVEAAGLPKLRDLMD